MTNDDIERSVIKLDAGDHWERTHGRKARRQRGLVFSAAIVFVVCCVTILAFA